MTKAPATAKKVGALLALSIFFLPMFFAWALLRRGYSGLARGLSFAWLAVSLAVIFALQSPAKTIEVAGVQTERPSEPSAQVMFVTAMEAEERDAPDGAVVNRIYRGQRLEITEAKGGWVRVTKDGFDPRWVRTADLSAVAPSALPEPNLPGDEDSRLSALPKIGEYGHDKADVAALRTAALELLKTGQCSQIDDANKSVTVGGVYYINCGEASNRFFRVSNGAVVFCGRSAASC